MAPVFRIKGNLCCISHKYAGQGGLVVKRPPGNQKVGGLNPTTATW